MFGKLKIVKSPTKVGGMDDDGEPNGNEESMTPSSYEMDEAIESSIENSLENTSGIITTEGTLESLLSRESEASTFLSQKTFDHDKKIWTIIDTFMKDPTNNLVIHHLDSFNKFMKEKIPQIFRERNPIYFMKHQNYIQGSTLNAEIYFGGEDGTKLYYGRPIIYDEENPSLNNQPATHFMFPNEARLRNMTYGITIHYDIVVKYSVEELPITTDIFALGFSEQQIIESYKNEVNSRLVSKELVQKYIEEDSKEKRRTLKFHPTIRNLEYTLKKVYLGRFPIMLQSDLCILNGLDPMTRFNMGECKHDYGGYFIVKGKEKVVVPQESFSQNMLYTRKFKTPLKINDDSKQKYRYSIEVRTASENTAKPVNRNTKIYLVDDDVEFRRGNIVVDVPNIMKPVPLFILFRAFGVISDHDIIEYCLLDLKKNEKFVDMFLPCVYDAGYIFSQEQALLYLSRFTKYKDIPDDEERVAVVMQIMMDYLFPHIGELNFVEKAYYLGYMVFRLLKMAVGDEKPTDRDHFKFRRVEQTGDLLMSLFNEYYKIMMKEFRSKLDIAYNNVGSGNIKNSNNGNLFESDILNSSNTYLQENFFSNLVVETGYLRGFKGRWGSLEYTERDGIVQPLNRLSYYSFISHLRKTVLQISEKSKRKEPHLLHNSQWGIIDFIDSPDGGHVGFHKHLAMSTHITSGTSGYPIIDWLRKHGNMIYLVECRERKYMYSCAKIFVNGAWVGVVEDPIGMVATFKLYRRNGMIPVYTSISHQVAENVVSIFTDAGRLTRPLFYVGNGVAAARKVSLDNKYEEGKKVEEMTWEEMVTGTGTKKKDEPHFTISNIAYDKISDLYNDTPSSSTETEWLIKHQGIVDYVDSMEAEESLVAIDYDTFHDDARKKKFTHVEIHPSLCLGTQSNLVIFPENNDFPRNVFSCSQSRQAASIYSTNFHNRIDKFGLTINYGQIPVVKSRYMKYINNEEIPYGENAIVAIMCYGGYNVEDAILVNEGAVKRGLFRCTYFTKYEATEESFDVLDSDREVIISNVKDDYMKHEVKNLKPNIMYDFLDERGLIRENTQLDDRKECLIGLKQRNGVTGVAAGSAAAIAAMSSVETNPYSDASVETKKGQLGFVDKTFITSKSAGYNMAKVRIRQDRPLAVGDKMASRAGQKGIVGQVIPERDMPYTREGVRPDIIINPHALPSRKTIGQLIECILGKGAVSKGCFGDCTPFVNHGKKPYDVYGKILVEHGYHSSGNEILYNGMTGEQIESEIFMGPTYYMRLKHMVQDKINYRTTGKRTSLTRQTNQGRANDGGLRIGEMESWAIEAHGLAGFLNDSMMTRGDEFYVAICNKSGMIAAYNDAKDIFLSPMVDGPLRYVGNMKEISSVQQLTRYGRDFSIVRIPYAFKLILQELQVMNVHMRIITEANIDQIENMGYSRNIETLAKNLYDIRELPSAATASASAIVAATTDEEEIKGGEEDENEEEEENNFETFIEGKMNRLKANIEQEKYEQAVRDADAAISLRPYKVRAREDHLEHKLEQEKEVTVPPHQFQLFQDVVWLDDDVSGRMWYIKEINLPGRPEKVVIANRDYGEGHEVDHTRLVLPPQEVSFSTFGDINKDVLQSGGLDMDMEEERRSNPSQNISFSPVIHIGSSNAEASEEDTQNMSSSSDPESRSEFSNLVIKKTDESGMSGGGGSNDVGEEGKGTGTGKEGFNIIKV